MGVQRAGHSKPAVGNLPLVHIFLFLLFCRLPSMDFDDQKQLCQVHPVLISCDMIDSLHVYLSVSAQTLKEKLGSSCQAVFIGLSVHPFASQQQVSDTLRAWPCRWRTT